DGFAIDSGCSVLCREGAPPESRWPYDVPAKIGVDPPSSVRNDCQRFDGLRYQYVPNKLGPLKGVLLSGFPICFYFEVFQSFLDAEHTGVLTTPARTDSPIAGTTGHSAVLSGYDDSTQSFKPTNSQDSQCGQP